IDRTIENLERDAQRLRNEIQAIDAASEKQEANWAAQLSDAGLPRLAPEALREWQVRLADSRAAANRLREREREVADAQKLAAELGAALHGAIAALGMVAAMPSPGEETRLDTLCALADEV